MAVGVALVWFGLKIALSALGAAGWKYGLKLFLILLVAMTAGRLIGRLMRLQKGLNRLGQMAKQKLSGSDRNDALLATTILFCATPLGLVGALMDGLGNVFAPLAIKGVIDGLATMAFVRMSGWRVMCAMLPMAVLLAAMTTVSHALEPWLRSHQLLDAVNVVGGFLVLYVSLIIFEVKKVELADYLPALAVAPALAWMFR
jgi:uncharacterized membrane protein YqgA involved in biofilm formation